MVLPPNWRRYRDPPVPGQEAPFIVPMGQPMVQLKSIGALGDTNALVSGVANIRAGL